MKKYVFLVILWAFFMLCISGCSMMPNDEDIINGSIMENEILDDGITEDLEIAEDLWITEDEGIVEDEGIIEDEEITEDESGSSEVDIEFVQ